MVRYFESDALTIALFSTGAIALDMGSFEGLTVGAQLTGSGTTSGDSDWILVQSNDGTNWSDISGATFTDLGDETLSTSVIDGFTMRFLGLKLADKGTETTGTATLRVTIK